MLRKPKIICMYLPQYHEIPENNEWWGKGFTEWTNVKKAKALFEGHLQPRIPLNEDYYNLSDANVIPRQMEIAKKYCVDGFCFYHYWFNGKLLLEKPVEALLESSHIPINFCLCWANEPWTRTWDGDVGSKQIIMAQEYGNEHDWEKHYDYLRRFFLNDRYLRMDSKPVFIIYAENQMPKIAYMLEKWDALAKEDGFDGLFIVAVHRHRAADEYPCYGSGVLDFEPFATFSEMNSMDRRKLYTIHSNGKKEYRTIDYEKFCEIMTGRYTFRNVNHFLGFFPGWDNSPRIGERVSAVFDNNSPEVFEKFFRIQYERTMDNNNDFLFINAWNEWGEGAFLEADIRYKYGYLEAIKNVIGSV